MHLYVPLMLLPLHVTKRWILALPDPTTLWGRCNGHVVGVLEIQWGYHWGTLQSMEA